MPRLRVALDLQAESLTVAAQPRYIPWQPEK